MLIYGDSNSERAAKPLCADPFFSENNMRHLNNIISKTENGTAKLIEHDIIEQ
ncbi:MAG: hypothetical protein LUC97_08635 [Clostridiales bacterium]|nr:hypothetical protein [Clostridiales bacterium]